MNRSEIESSLIKCLDDESASIRIEAINSLLLMGSLAAIPYIMKSLEDPDRYVREVAIKTLGRLGAILKEP